MRAQQGDFSFGTEVRQARYRAEITAGALKVAESRIIAGLLLDRVDSKSWKTAIEEENRLRARNPATAMRLARLIRDRLLTMDADLWKLVRDATKPWRRRLFWRPPSNTAH